MAKDKTEVLTKPDAKTYPPLITIVNLPSPSLAPMLLSMVDDGYKGPPVVGTLDFDSDDGIERYLASGAKVDIDRMEAAEDWFLVESWCAEKKQNVSQEEGIVKPGVRVTLFSPTGDTFGFSGIVPHDSFTKIRAIFGDGPWPGGIWFRAKPFLTGNNMATYVLLARRTKPEAK